MIEIISALLYIQYLFRILRSDSDTATHPGRLGRDMLTLDACFYVSHLLLYSDDL